VGRCAMGGHRRGNLGQDLLAADLWKQPLHF
jgi:hypothetical protein